MSQAPPSTISDSDWYKKQGGKLTLLDYSADLFKVRLLPPHCPRRPPDHRLCFTASHVLQVGTEIVHFFIDIDEETGKRKALVSTVTPMEKKRIMSVFSRLDKDHLFFYAASLHEVIHPKCYMCHATRLVVRVVSTLLRTT